MSVFGLMLQWGASVADVLNELDRLGFFSYILPFLLIFAVVYAILAQIPIFKDKTGPAMIVALSVGLLSLQFGDVSQFFATIFPRLGVGLSVLLVALILAGAFISGDENKTVYTWVFFGLGALIFLFVVLDSLSIWPVFGSWWWERYLSVIIVLGIIIAAIVLVVKTSASPASTP
ncbi:MAG: hypothetical protein KKF56_00810 [Nanoarchaeota archaeon]|nr:hypothetical protein [Nanoarchaeota archaeon]